MNLKSGEFLLRSGERIVSKAIGQLLTIDSAYWRLISVAHALTASQKRLVQELLKVGRWNNESEIIRYGLHLVAREVEMEQARSYERYGAGVLARAYKRLTRTEREEEELMESASAKPSPGELE